MALKIKIFSANTTKSEMEKPCEWKCVFYVIKIISFFFFDKKL
jgi:hypothetical protein